jgi:hypothetical protein
MYPRKPFPGERGVGSPSRAASAHASVASAAGVAARRRAWMLLRES